jgi:hypothetical protein
VASGNFNPSGAPGRTTPYTGTPSTSAQGAGRAPLQFTPYNDAPRTSASITAANLPAGTSTTIGALFGRPSPTPGSTPYSEFLPPGSRADPRLDPSSPYYNPANPSAPYDRTPSRPLPSEYAPRSTPREPMSTYDPRSAYTPARSSTPPPELFN